MEVKAEIIWGVLRSGGYTQSDFQIRTMPTNVVTLGGSVRLALGPGDEPRVLIPLGERELIFSPSVEGLVSVTVSCFIYEGRLTRFIDLICLSKNLESVFGEVVGEILARINAGIDSASAVTSSIADFRSLLMSSGGNEGGLDVIVGLIGELLFLNRLLDISASGWRAWSGPSGDRHDFRRGCTSLEVKSTTYAGKSIVSINGLEQLEVPSGGSLHLLRFVLEPVVDGNLSVSGLASSALSKADEPVRLGELLSAIGCENFNDSKWNFKKFRVQSESLYEVRDGFPRLTSSMLLAGAKHAGLSAINYSVDLSFASNFLVPESSYDELEKELGG